MRIKTMLFGIAFIFLIILTCCSTNENNTSNSTVFDENIVQSSPKVVDEDDSNNQLIDQEKVLHNYSECLLLISEKKDWNTWELLVPITVATEQIPTQVLKIQLTLPSLWVPNYTDKMPNRDCNVVFVESEDLNNKVDKLSGISVLDYSQREDWRRHDHKIDYFQSKVDEFTYKNDLMIEKIKVNGVDWLLYCGFYTGTYDYDELYKNNNFCTVYTAYKDSYQISYRIDIRDKDLNDPATRELIETILASWKVISIEDNGMIVE